MRFSGKVAIVTGGAIGIGRAICFAFAGEGAKVIIADIDVEAAKTTAKEIEEVAGEALPLKVDVTSSKEVKAAVDNVLRQYGKVDILVNNAGIVKREPFMQNTEETWDKMIDVNFKGPLIFSRAVLDCMIKQNYGKIVNISSITAIRGFDMVVAYGAAKAAVDSLTKSLAKVMAPYKININCVAPGGIDTPMRDNAYKGNKEGANQFIELVPWQRIGRAEEVAAAVLFLASDEAEYITGQILVVDGGRTLV